jgi:hypothetical protein
VDLLVDLERRRTLSIMASFRLTWRGLGRKVDVITERDFAHIFAPRAGEAIPLRDDQALALKTTSMDFEILGAIRDIETIAWDARSANSGAYDGGMALTLAETKGDCYCSSC